MVRTKSRVFAIAVVVLGFFVCILPGTRLRVLQPTRFTLRAAAMSIRPSSANCPMARYYGLHAENAKGSWAKVITYGATLTELYVPDRSGKPGDVVLGFSDLQGYLSDQPSSGHRRAHANRIAKGHFTLDARSTALRSTRAKHAARRKDRVNSQGLEGGNSSRHDCGCRFDLAMSARSGEENFPGILAFRSPIR